LHTVNVHSAVSVDKNGELRLETAKSHISQADALLHSAC